MTSEVVVALTLAAFAVAVLYSSVGHAGASGYLAAMALLGVAPAAMRPTALALNILVATIAAWKFRRAGHFSWRLFWPFALTSVPMAFLGGRIALPVEIYRSAVGVVLLASAYRLIRPAPARSEREPFEAPPAVPVALALGAVLGFLAGLVGVGGGIFLSPLLLLMGWATIRPTAAVSAAFILVNSAAGLLGNAASVQALPREIPIFLLAVAVGGWIGAELGSRKLPPLAVRRLLAAVLVLAGAKLLLT
jgi:hypothetical protein